MLTFHSHISNVAVRSRRRRCKGVCMSLGGPPRAAAWIEERLPHVGNVTGERMLGGSNWSSAGVYDTSSGIKLFVKTSSESNAASMFEGEALGLQAMERSNAIRVPRVFDHGPMPGGSRNAFIVMEYLELGRSRVNRGQLGKKLAQMHLSAPKDDVAATGKFGFPVDNTIGGTPQPNGWSDSWVDFFREKRLLHQLNLTGDTKLLQLGNKILPKLDRFFEDAGEIHPSILHGDLWSGNIATCEGEPVIFDPASYYGHHEAEWGMSWCAGFGTDFWHAYHELIPKAPGWDDRHRLYTLYHILNHYNLFGDSYYDQAAGIMEDLIRRKI